MSPVLLSLLIGVSGLAIFVLLHILILQIFNIAREKRFKFFNRFFLVMVIVVAVAGFIIPNQVTFHENETIGSILLVFFFLFMFFFVSMVTHAVLDHSVRARLSIEIRNRKGKPVLKSEVLKNYNPHMAIKKRLDQLVVGGYAENAPRGYKLVSKGIFFAKISNLGKLIYRMGLGG